MNTPSSDQQKTRALSAEDRRILALLDREEKRLRARESFQDFIEYMMPDPQDYDNVLKTAYVSKPVHKLMVRWWEEIDSMKSMRSALSVPPQNGKPVAETELVLMGDGSRKRLGDVAVGDMVITKEGRPRRVEAVHEQGELPCVTIKTRAGRDVTAALDHPMLTPSGWVNAGDILPRMSLLNVVPSLGNGGGFECEARLAGYFVGDGSCGEYDNGAGCMNVSATITTEDDETLEDIKTCASAMGFSYSVRNCPGKARQISLSSGVREWLRKTGLAGKVSRTKRVPEFVFTAGSAAVSNFIGAYFACDGTVSLKGLDRHGRPRPDACIEFYSVSRDLLKDVQHLLL
ncbi:MAG TPA: LAGLIDADG family homing endonuclease, partial [Alphaproteobacteria bacterium]|nr:LAGLIDADG family homing endonuclease [Alphaproteobacteria bacterium]